jgi:glycerol-3-phosphate dehydrogenase (NAD(P)+)
MAEREFAQIGVIGAGAWGTALANLLAKKGCRVDLWVREEEVYGQIQAERVNRVFLPGVTLAPGLRPVRSHHDAASAKDLVIMVVPSHVFREVLQHVIPHLEQETAVLTATKGIENQTLLTMSQIVKAALPEKWPGAERVACLSGPSFAREVSRGNPTAVTIACRDPELGIRLQHLFSSESFRAYLTDDLMGVELSGALKNVVAIAAGIADGLEVGHNTRAALITRGLAEMTRLGVALGARPATFAGLAGMGDLVLTCTGDLSRNRSVGLQIGRGMRLQDVLSGINTVAEGVKTTLSAYHLALKTRVDMPIVEQVYRVLYENKDPREALRDLMTRDLKREPEY